MEAHEAAQQVRSVAAAERARHEHESHFRDRVAILIAVMAASLAIASVLAQSSSNAQINANVDAADVRSQHEADVTQLRTYQQTIQTDQEQLADPGLPPAVRSLIEQHLQQDQRAVAQLQSDPSQGDGIDELAVQERTTEQAQATDSAHRISYILAGALFQIAIVLASVAILAVSAPIVAMSATIGAVALILLLNGIFLLVRL